MLTNQETKIEALPKDTLSELVKQSRNLSKQMTSLVEYNQKLSVRMANYSIVGAMFASLIGAFWVLNYLNSIAILYAPLVEYVTGATFGASTAFQSTETLFVMVARFILAFGFSWTPITLLIALLDIVRQTLSKGRSSK